MNRSGIVMKIDKKAAFLMTSSGEFVKVKISGKAPEIGEDYAGSVVVKTNIFKHAAIAASLMFLFITGGGAYAYAYYTPVTSVVVDINPSIELKANRFDKVIKANPLNEDAKVILSEVDLKNQTLDNALNLIVQESKEHNYINDAYIESGKAITVKIDSKNKNKHFELPKFEQYVNDNDLKVKIKEKGTTVELKNKSNNKNGNNKEDKNPGKTEEDKNKNPNKPDKDKNTSTNNTDSKNNSSGSKTSGSEGSTDKQNNGNDKSKDNTNDNSKNDNKGSNPNKGKTK